MRSFDGYANVVLENAFERVYVGDSYCDIEIPGWFIVRAENVVLVGEVGEKDSDIVGKQKLEKEEILRLRKEEREKEKEKKKIIFDAFDDVMDDFS